MTMIPGEDVHVDVAAIERQLAELWRAEKGEKEAVVTRAALWNVVAHAWTPQQRARAAEVLARASEEVPQRALIIQADPGGADTIEAWISANCHLVGQSKQVCSEEVSIVAGGARIHHLAPVVSALLLPDMPVAVWWVGDLPEDRHDYAMLLLDPADRLIVDSAQFTGPSDFDLVCRIAGESSTMPADLNWVRIEEWRAATATLFDPESMRARLRQIKRVQVRRSGGSSFGELADALLYGSWFTAQTGIDIPFDVARVSGDEGIASVAITFDDELTSLIRRDGERGVVIAHAETENGLEAVTRTRPCETHELIVRLLERPEADPVYLKTIQIAKRVSR